MVVSNRVHIRTANSGVFRESAMPNVYVEPQPTGRPDGAPITGYHLKLPEGKKLVETTFATQKEAIDKARALGHKPSVARVRNTSIGNPDHWRSAD